MLSEKSMVCLTTPELEHNATEETSGHPALPLIATEQAAIRELESKVNALRNNVLTLEARVAELGVAAITMPEDLGDWSEAPPRVSGLVARIIQTHQLAAQVASLSNNGSNVDPNHSNPVDRHDVGAANEGALQ